MPHALDETDVFLLSRLQEDAALQNVELARAAGLSPSATLQRVRRLRRDGLICGIHARLDAARVGLGVRAHVMVRLPKHDATADTRFQTAIESMDRVVAADWIAGEWDAILEVVATDLEDLHSIIVKVGKVGATRVTTYISVRPLKKPTPLPLDVAERM
jgi:Lrp/AsnC family leucine-responsive transcriptional regulator